LQRRNVGVPFYECRDSSEPLQRIEVKGPNFGGDVRPVIVDAERASTPAKSEPQAR
jgi:hypothetical protein